MLKTREVSMMQVREKLGQYADEVYYNRIPLLVKRKNKVIIEIMPPGTSKLLDDQRERDFKIFDEIREMNKNISAIKLDKIINQAVEEVRAEKRKAVKNKK